MRGWWKALWILLYPLPRWILGLRVRGADHVPGEGSVVLAPNHRSYWDPPLVGVAAPREVFFLAKQELFSGSSLPARAFARLITWLHAIPLRRTAGGHRALREALRLLRQGRVIVIFPEGTRNKTRYPLLPFRRGVVFLAYRAGVPVVPTWIKNARQPVWKWILRLASPEVRFGEPLTPKKGESQEAFAWRLMEALISLADPEDQAKHREALNRGHIRPPDRFEGSPEREPRLKPTPS